MSRCVRAFDSLCSCADDRLSDAADGKLIAAYGDPFMPVECLS